MGNRELYGWQHHVHQAFEQYSHAVLVGDYRRLVGIKLGGNELAQA
jgi:hypothetical protein